MSCHSVSARSEVYRIPILMWQVVKKVHLNLRIYWAFLSFQTGSKFWIARFGGQTLWASSPRPSPPQDCGGEGDVNWGWCTLGGRAKCRMQNAECKMSNLGVWSLARRAQPPN